MMDNDYDALVEIINRKYMYIDAGTKLNKKHINHALNNHSKIFINQIDLSLDYKEIISRVEPKKYGIPQDGVSFVVCNLALHYIIPTREKIKNFCMMLNKLLSPGGIFVFTAFNSRKIFDLLKTKDNAKVSAWERYKNGKLIYSIKKKYRSCEFTGINQQIDVLLPFSDEYYTENLINIDVLNEELGEKNIKMIDDKSFQEYLTEFSDNKTHLFNQLTDIDKEYISLYHMYIYKKKGNRVIKSKNNIPKFKLNKEYHETEIIKKKSNKKETKTDKRLRLMKKWNS